MDNTSKETPRTLFRSKAAVVARALTLALWAAISRLFGLVRDLSMAWLVGAGEVGDALVISIFLPHALRKLLGDGILSLPFTTGAIAGGLEKIQTNSFIKIFTPSIFFLIKNISIYYIILLIVVNCAIYIFQYLNTGNNFYIVHSIRLFYESSFYVITVFFSAFAMGILHTKGRFSCASASQVIFNLAILLLISLAALGCGQPDQMIAFGFSFSGVVQMVWLFSCLYYCLRKDTIGYYLPEKKLSLKEKILSLRLKKSIVFLPNVICASLSIPLIFLAGIVLAYFIGVGEVSALYFSDRLLELPVGIIGSCIGIASLPDLSRTATQKEQDSFWEYFAFSVRMSLIISIPAACGLFAIAPELSRIFFFHGAFSEDSYLAVVRCLRCLCFVLPACVVFRICIVVAHTKCLNRFIYISTATSFVLTILLGSILMFFLDGESRAISSPLSISIVLLLNTVLYLSIFVYKYNLKNKTRFKKALNFRFLTACILCGAIVGAVAKYTLFTFCFNELLLMMSSCLLGLMAWCIMIRFLFYEEYKMIFKKNKYF